MLHKAVVGLELDCHWELARQYAACSLLTQETYSSLCAKSSGLEELPNLYVAVQTLRPSLKNLNTTYTVYMYIYIEK